MRTEGLLNLGIVGSKQSKFEAGFLILTEFHAAWGKKKTIEEVPDKMTDSFVLGLSFYSFLGFGDTSFWPEMHPIEILR